MHFLTKSEYSNTRIGLLANNTHPSVFSSFITERSYWKMCADMKIDDFRKSTYLIVCFAPLQLKGDTPEDSNQNGDRRIDRTQAGVDKGSNHADFVADGSLA